MAVTVGLIAQTVEDIAPKYWAEDWDNVGLLVGNMADKVERILLALDGTPEVVAEAMELKAQLIIAHHPLMFRPLKNLRSDNPQAQVPLQLLKQGISYYAAHTNLDQSRLSSSWLLGQSLGLQELDILALAGYEKPVKLAADDLIPLQNRGQARGYGGIGYLAQADSLGNVWSRLLSLLRDQPWAEKKDAGKLTTNFSGIRLAGEWDKPVRKVAIVNGSGGSFLPKALFQGADLFIGGDIDHHAVLEALQGGMAVADIGHFISEKPMLFALAGYLRSAKTLSEIEFIISSANQSPWIVQSSENE